ncbi:MAG: hypothetical protein P9M14_03105 [Candidatus Alcyoniella australis]|nr:hypothetical protein [Candidatus Alcyoniella australis]
MQPTSTSRLFLIALLAAALIFCGACTQIGNHDQGDDDAPDNADDDDQDLDDDDQQPDDDDDSGGDDDDDYDPSDTTIYDIQQGRVPVETVVTCKGIIVTSPLAIDTPGIFVQEPEGGEYSGIFLFLYDEVVAELDVAVGDVVDVTGLYTEYYNMSELTVQSTADLTITGSNQNVLPEVVQPADVANGGSKSEAFESVLVKVEDESVTNRLGLALLLHALF